MPPTKPGECDKATIEHNAGEAEKLGKHYFRVRGAKIEGSAGGKVSISVPRKGGGRITLKDLVWGDTDKMWVYCPATLPSAAIHPRPGDPPKKNAAGTLYLEQGFVKDNGIASADPTPKWPRALPEQRAEPLPVIPIKLVLTALELADDGEDREITVDLMDPKLAPEQTITIGDRAITILLTRDGFASVSIPFPSRLDLVEAHAIIQARPSPSAMAEAFEVVARCLERIQANQWPEPVQKSGERLTADKALALIREVTNIP